MERIGQWNIYKIEDVNKMQRRGTKTIMSDGYYGNRTISATSIACDDLYSTVTVNAPSQAEMKPFKCPCCGGNSYKNINGKTVCEYCDTEFIR